ncbi:hypothetical protein KA344_09300 [bacterium]|jgi:nicotinamidase-related amidase|nr:hypothetical protein [bacterium]
MKALEHAPSSVLIIIDMQEHFVTECSEKIYRALVREIWLAKAQKQPIMEVLFDGYGTTVHRIRRHLENYEHLIAGITKRRMDKSSEIVEALNKHRLTPKLIKVGGVSVRSCINSTVCGLSEHLTSLASDCCIEVIQDGCGPYQDWRDFFAAPNIRLVPGGLI